MAVNRIDGLSVADLVAGLAGVTVFGNPDVVCLGAFAVVRCHGWLWHRTTARHPGRPHRGLPKMVTPASPATKSATDKSH